MLESLSLRAFPELDDAVPEEHSRINVALGHEPLGMATSEAEEIRWQTLEHEPGYRHRSAESN